MSAGSLTMVCLMMVSGQTPAPAAPLPPAPVPAAPAPVPTAPAPVPAPAPAETVYINQRTIKIPVDIDSARQREVRELVLYASPDEGKTWERYAKIAPDKDSFNYYARGDGTYWFRVAAVNLQGKQDPENLHKGPPDLKVIIDSVKPQMRITSAQRQGDDLVVSWSIREDHPDADSLKLEYRTLDSASSVWLPIELKAGPTGQAKVRLTSQAPVAVRMTMKDLARNVSYAEAEVQGSVATASYAGGNHPAAGGQPPAPAPAGQVVLPPPPPPAPTPTQEAKAAPVQSLPTPPTSPASVPSSDPIPTGQGTQGSFTGTVGSASPPQLASAKASLPATVDDPRDVIGSTVRAAASSPPVHSAMSSPGAPLAAASPSRGLAKVRLVNEKEITLTYQLSKVGPSGIGTVELYLTQDGGQSWVRFAEDPDAQKASAGGSYKRTLELPGEGVFGLYLVVRNRAGLGKAPPKPGDAPEMMIEVDLTPPVAELRKPKAIPEKRDSLLLRWDAKDRNLADRPIALEYAKEPNGPWEKIATDLVNNGSHLWQVPQGLVYVYLRLRVHDNAGNEAVAVSAEPQLVDLTEPEGCLVDITPAKR